MRDSPGQCSPRWEGLQGTANDQEAREREREENGAGGGGRGGVGGCVGLCRLGTWSGDHHPSVTCQSVSLHQIKAAPFPSPSERAVSAPDTCLYRCVARCRVSRFSVLQEAQLLPNYASQIHESCRRNAVDTTVVCGHLVGCCRLLKFHV